MQNGSTIVWELVYEQQARETRFAGERFDSMLGK
jgi:hypothetical protein